MDTLVTFDRNVNGTFTKKVDLPEESSTGRDVGLLALGAAVVVTGQICWAALKEWWDKRNG
jgi:hypothetical protein